MELVVSVEGQQAMAAALEVGVDGVACNLPLSPEASWWSQAYASRDAARQRGTRFYLIWDWLVPEGEWAGGLKTLARMAQMAPEALVIRDMGLCREIRRRYPGLKLHAAGNWGCHNSLGLRQAEALGFSRVVVDAPLGLKDLALMRRQSSLPLEVVLPHTCPGFMSLCLLREYLGTGCRACEAFLGRHIHFADTWGAALEMLSGLAQLGVEAVQVAGLFPDPETLSQAVQLLRMVGGASPAARPQVLTAAREVLAAFGERFRVVGKNYDQKKEEAEPPKVSATRGRVLATRPPSEVPPPSRLWLEARSFEEAAELARQWRQPLVVPLTPENYAAFLPKHRRWEPRRLIWRLPLFMRETSLGFYQKAVETLRQGGYQRFVVSDWGSLGLVRSLEGEAYGDQTLGVRNSQALFMALENGAARVCLPPGRPAAWQDLVAGGPKGRFWAYLHHFPALAVFPQEAVAAFSSGGKLFREKLRWLAEGDLSLLCRKAPEHLPLESVAGLLKQAKVGPLLMALPHSGLPWGQVPAWLAPGPKRPGRPGP